MPRNFARLVRQLVGHKTHRDLVYLPDGRTVRAAAFPISIDAAGFEELATSPQAAARAEEIRTALGRPRKVFLGCDRLDYTKGIYARLRAFSELIDDGHFDVEDAVFIQVAVPSPRAGRAVPDPPRRDRAPRRPDQRRARPDRPAGRALPAHVPVAREEMAAFYRVADVMVVTPYRDGMNLVAKEYVACRADNDGALVLSEFAGAADELRQAWLVNPYDINGMKAALLAAYQADEQEVSRRMKAMRKQVTQNDVTAWADSFMSALAEQGGAHHDKTVRRT